MPAGQAAVRRDGQKANPVHRTNFEQGMQRLAVLGGLGGQVRDYLVDFLGIGATLQHRILGAAHLGGGNQRHGVGYLARILHAADSSPYVAYAWHAILFFNPPRPPTPPGNGSPRNHPLSLGVRGGGEGLTKRGLKIVDGLGQLRRPGPRAGCRFRRWPGQSPDGRCSCGPATALRKQTPVPGARHPSSRR